MKNNTINIVHKTELFSSIKKNETL